MVGGYDHNSHENKIKLYIFNEYYNEIINSKNIWIKKNDIFKELPKIKSINRIDYKTIMVICSEGEGKKEKEKSMTYLLEIMNLETKEQKENKSESLIDNIERIKKNSFKLKPIFSNILSIKSFYLLKNNYFILVHDLETLSFLNNFEIPGLITCICQINEKLVIICSNKGLYNLDFSNNKIDKDAVTIEKIKDMKYTLVLQAKNKNNNIYYIVSLPKRGTFILSRDISSINENFLNKDNIISKNTYSIGVITETNSLQIVIFIDNDKTKNQCIIEIFDINNIKNAHKIIYNNYLYTLSKNCIASFKALENSDNTIILCVAKKEDKNGIYAHNIGLPFHKKIIEFFKEIYNLEIICLSPFRKGNIKEEKYFIYFHVGGININKNVEISLYKIKYLDDQGKNCLSFEWIESYIYDKEQIIINSIYQNFNQIIIAFNYNICIMDKPYNDEEE